MHYDGKNARAERIRIALLLLLVPLLGTIIWQVNRFAPRYIRDLAFSSDGHQLLASLTKWDDHGESIEGSSVVKTWDVQSGRLIRSEHVGQGTIILASNAENYIDFTRSGHIRILDPGTDKPLNQWDLPEEFGEIQYVWCNEQLAIAYSLCKNGKSYATCLDSEGVRILTHADWVDITVSDTAARHAVDHRVGSCIGWRHAFCRAVSTIGNLARLCRHVWFCPGTHGFCRDLGSTEPAPAVGTAEFALSGGRSEWRGPKDHHVGRSPARRSRHLE